MNDPFYEFASLYESHRYDFLSIGKKVIHKTVIYCETDDPKTFSLILADVMPDHSLDFMSTSNNGDMKVVLATVIQTLKSFLTLHPDANVAFTGSTPSRTRLYNILISQELPKVADSFRVFGIKGSHIERFQLNGCYNSFLVSL